jgi:hypothetical protein
MSTAIALLLLRAFMVYTDTPLPSCALDLFFSDHMHMVVFLYGKPKEGEKVAGHLIKFILYTVY